MASLNEALNKKDEAKIAMSNAMYFLGQPGLPRKQFDIAYSVWVKAFDAYRSASNEIKKLNEDK